MWTVEERIDPRLGAEKLGLKMVVYGLDVFSRVESESDTALVRDDDGPHAGGVQSGYSVGHSRKKLEILDRADVLSFRHFVVNHAISIEEDRLQSRVGPVRLREHVCYDSSAITAKIGQVKPFILRVKATA